MRVCVCFRVFIPTIMNHTPTHDDIWHMCVCVSSPCYYGRRYAGDCVGSVPLNIVLRALDHLKCLHPPGQSKHRDDDSLSLTVGSLGVPSQLSPLPLVDASTRQASRRGTPGQAFMSTHNHL